MEVVNQIVNELVDKVVENWDKDVPKFALEAAEFERNKFNLAKASVQEIKASMEQTQEGERQVMNKLRHELIDAEEIEAQTKDSLVTACFDAVFLAVFMPVMKSYVGKSSAVRIAQIQKNKELKQQEKEKEKEKSTHQMNLVPDKSVDLPSVSNHHNVNLFYFSLKHSGYKQIKLLVWISIFNEILVSI